MAFTSPVYIEQMALATGLNSRTEFDEIRACRRRGTPAGFAEIRNRFADYVLFVDKSRSIPLAAPEYAGVAEVRKKVRGLSLASATTPTAGETVT